jgi:hypothetical protein
MSDSALKHIEHLSVAIGPRGSTTPKEKEGHEYVHKVLSDLGCEPRTETFLAPTSTYTPVIFGLGVALLAEVLFWFISPTPNAAMGALAAAVLAVLATASLLLEIWPADTPARWFVPSAPSQNVIGVTRAGGEARRKIAVLAHVDTHRTPLFWRNRTNFRVYRVLTTLGFAGLAALCVIFVVGIFAPGGALRVLSLIPTVFVLLAWLMVVQAHFTPFTHGANDNASGVGILLALAERLKQQPLANTEVWWVATGCEEMPGAFGSADFVRRHRAEFENGLIVVVDNVAGKGADPTYLTSEGILVMRKFSPEGLALVEQVASDRPELKARPSVQQGAGTDATPALMAGLKAVGFLGFTPDGWIPDWHNQSDTFDKVDADAVDRTERFVLALMQKYDAG